MGFVVGRDVPCSSFLIDTSLVVTGFRRPAPSSVLYSFLFRMIFVLLERPKGSLLLLTLTSPLGEGRREGRPPSTSSGLVCTVLSH